MNYSMFASILALPLLLSGCETQTSVPPSVATPAAPPLMDESVPQVARAACLGEVGRVTNAAPLTITAMVDSPANSQITVAVGPQRAPWLCLVSRTGIVQNVMSQTDEGRL